MLGDNTRQRASESSSVNQAPLTEIIIKEFANAAKNGDVGAVISTVDKFKNSEEKLAQLLAPNKMGLTPLHYAAAQGRIECVTKILEAVKPNRELLKKLFVQSNAGSPWQAAVMGNQISVMSEFLDFVDGDLELFKLLIESKKPSIALGIPSHPLSLLIVRGNGAIATRMLNMAKGDKELLGRFLIPDESGMTVLHTAAAWGHYNIVKSLLDAGVDFTVKNLKGKTALDLAKTRILQTEKDDNRVKLEIEKIKKVLARIEKGLLNIEPITKMLSNAKVTPSRVNRNELPDDAKLYKVVEELLKVIPADDESEFAQRLQEEYGRYAALFVAISTGNPKLVKDAIDAGMDVNGKDIMGDLPMLHVALVYLYPEVVKTLLELGADPEARSRRENQTALEFLQEVEKNYLSSKSDLEEEIAKLNPEIQRLLNATEIVAVLEKKMSTTAMPIPAVGNKVDVGDMKVPVLRSSIDQGQNR